MSGKTTKYNDGQNDLVCKRFYYEDGSVRREEYYLNDKRHRTDGPAYIWYNKDGSVSSEHYYLNDKIHRTDGPADIWYYEDGSIDCEWYCLNGKYHRTDGPAVILYYEDGNVGSEEYWLNDNILTREIRNDRINKALFKGRYVEVDGKLMVAGNK